MSSMAGPLSSRPKPTPRAICTVPGYPTLVLLPACRLPVLLLAVLPACRLPVLLLAVRRRFTVTSPATAAPPPALSSRNHPVSLLLCQLGHTATANNIARLSRFSLSVSHIPFPSPQFLLPAPLPSSSSRFLPLSLSPVLSPFLLPVFLFPDLSPAPSAGSVHHYCSVLVIPEIHRAAGENLTR